MTVSPSVKKRVYKFIFGVLALYLLLCGVLYFNQEKLLFLPNKLNQNYVYGFGSHTQELNLTTKDGTTLNGLLFTTPQPKGLIFYLHGNAGNLASWGNVAALYNALHYDVFLLDYRGYGKSGGTIANENQLYADNQMAYNEMKKRYPEKNITVLGYSIGTGMAAQLAATNKPKLLILQAPYYSMTDLAHQILPFIPSWVLKYKLATNVYVKQCQMPIVIFHGTSDEVIPYTSSVQLQRENKTNVTLISLQGQAHNGITENNDYRDAVAQVLE